MHTYDLDDDVARPGSREGRGGRRHWWAALVVLLVIVGTAAAIGIDQRRRSEEFTALIDQVERGQSAIRYSDARIQAMVQYTSPLLTSARAPEPVRAGLRQLVQQAAAERMDPTRVRRDAVADLEVARWHGAQRRARDAYRAYLDQQLVFLQTATVNLRVLYRPRTESGRLRAAARTALLEASPDAAGSARIRALLP